MTCRWWLRIRGGHCRKFSNHSLSRPHNEWLRYEEDLRRDRAAHSQFLLEISLEKALRVSGCNERKIQEGWERSSKANDIPWSRWFSCQCLSLPASKQSGLSHWYLRFFREDDKGEHTYLIRIYIDVHVFETRPFRVSRGPFLGLRADPFQQRFQPLHLSCAKQTLEHSSSKAR